MSPQEIAELHKAMLGNYRVDQKVRALERLGDTPSGDSPGGLYASPGEILIVRAINPTYAYPVAVSHEHITDRTFGVAVNEIEPFEDQANV